MQVIVINSHNTESWTSTTPIFKAVAWDKDSAKRWIQDEVDGKHESGLIYASGKDVNWWIEHGVFSLTTVEVQE